MKNVKCYKKNYPRPQFVRENWMNLNGKWDFKFDDENIGEKEFGSCELVNDEDCDGL